MEYQNSGPSGTLRADASMEWTASPQKLLCYLKNPVNVWPVFSSQTYVNLNEYDYSLYANVTDLAAE